MNQQEKTATQIFAADGPLRGYALRVVLIGGGLLLAAWLAALVFGAYGGLGGFPRLDLMPGGSSSAQAAKTAPETAGGAVPDKAGEPSGTGAAGASPSTSPAGPGGSISRPAASAGSGSATQGTKAARGKPAGSGTGTGSGKPYGTPGAGGAGSNAGGVGKGNAFGISRAG
jgi:hypothetical protein